MAAASFHWPIESSRSGRGLGHWCPQWCCHGPHGWLCSNGFFHCPGWRLASLHGWKSWWRSWRNIHHEGWSQEEGLHWWWEVYQSWWEVLRQVWRVRWCFWHPLCGGIHCSNGHLLLVCAWLGSMGELKRRRRWATRWNSASAMYIWTVQMTWVPSLQWSQFSRHRMPPNSDADKKRMYGRNTSFLRVEVKALFSRESIGRWQTFGTVCVFEVILWGVFIRSWCCAKVLFFTFKGYSCSSGKWLGLQEVGSQHLVLEVYVQNQFKSPWLKQRQFAEAQSFAFAEDHGSGTWHLNDGCRRFEAAFDICMVHGWKWVLKCYTFLIFVKLLQSAV